MIYVISYDIESDRMRTKLAKLLEGYGVRIQYSVFECSLTEQRFKKLYREILKLTTEDCPGSVRFYAICRNCENRIVTIGKPMNELAEHRKEIIIV
ncbi:MAG: CRISPR-associated endonuclease Cas2 [Lachnospiraceae bacterium]|nr:CRISPR-associated endonuclease Cas2 [Lachnospiraceae bacterium]